MDLLKVKVENFRCFEGAHVLDMTDGPLWVVRGENGSGKSTLVCDSILFALFNTIPSLEGTQSLKKTDLINLKSKSMSVQIWFNHNGNRYSIKRSYQVKGKTDQLHHQFEVWQNNKELINTPKQEEARVFVTEKFWEIEDFRNTTIVLQKEITSSIDQRESERKKSIEKIFNIERFAKMSEVAHEKSRETSNDIKIVSNNLDEIKKHIVNEEELQEKMFNAQELLKTTTIQKESKETTIKEKKAIKENLDKVVMLGKNIQEKIQHRRIDLNSNEAENQVLQDELIKITNDLEKEPELISKLQTIEQLEDIINKSSRIVEDIKVKEKEIDTYNKLISGKEKSLQTELTGQEKSRVALTTQVKTINAEISNFKEIEALIPILTEKIKTLPGIIKTKDAIQKEVENTEALEKTIYGKEKDLEGQKKIVKDQLGELSKKTTKLTNLENDKKIAEENITKNRVLGKQLEQETENLDELQQKEQELKNKLFQIEQEIEISKRSINDVIEENKEILSLDTKGICPKCKQKLNENHISEITQENSLKLKDLELKVGTRTTLKKNCISDLESVRKDLDTKKKKFQQLDSIKEIFIAERTKLEAINKQINSLNEEMKSLQELKQKYDQNALFSSLESEIALLKTKLPNLQKLKSNKTELEQQILDLSNKEIQLTGLKNQLKFKPEKEKLLNSLSKDINEITKKIESEKKLLESKQYAIEENKALAELSTQLFNLKKDLPDVEKTRLNLNTLDPDQTRSIIKLLEKQKGIREEKVKRIQSLKKALNIINNDIHDLQEQFSQLELEKISPDVEKYKNDIEALDRELFDLNKSLAKYEIELQAIADLIVKNNQYLNDYKIKNKEFGQLKNLKDDYDLLENLFKDIGKRILNRVISRINLYSTEILSRLGNEQLEQIMLVESKSGFELKIVSGGEERYPNWFSGGQKVRIGLAFRLSLSKTLAEVTGGDIETILIDEGDFGALDEYGLKGVAEILNDLKNFFKRMVIVTHMDHLANELDGKRLLIKDNKIIQETLL